MSPFKAIKTGKVSFEGFFAANGKFNLKRPLAKLQEGR